MNAIRSDAKEFDIDDVTIDLYTGWFGSNITGDENGSNYHVAFYIIAHEYRYWNNSQLDYHNIENQYFITEMPDFNTKLFEAWQTESKGKNFNYSETITIPKELFKNSSGVLELYVLIVEFSYEDNLYHFDFMSSDTAHISYTFNNDNSIHHGK